MSELPEGWAETTLGEVANWGSGGTPSRSEPSFYGGTIPWIKSGELNSRYVTTTEEFITEAAIKNSSAKLFPAGSVAIAMYGATIGKTSILGVDASTNQACAVGAPVEGVIGKEFLYRLLQSEKEAFIEKGKGGAQPNISQAVIKAHGIYLPPQAEQIRIAQKLDELLAKVNTLKTRIDSIPTVLKKFRRSVIASAASGRLTEEWRQGKSVDWIATTLADVIEKKPRNGYSPKTAIYKTTTKTLSLSATTAGVFKGECFKYIDEEISSESYLWLKPGDILIQRANTLEYVGVSAIYDGEPNKYIYPDLMMKCRAKDNVLTKYLHICLSSHDTRKYFRDNATGTAGNMPKINQQTVMNAPIFLPSLQEQTEIVRRVEQLFAFADQLEAKVASAKNRIDHLAQSILAKAFRGELVPQDPNDEPASVLLERIKAQRTAEPKTSRTRKSA
ncbi:MAG: restriction endonuclease subunit S [Gammaproteobacteria bacterium]|nr:restriction endonuclease subunit S [Gammaproteobacteria bacterium]MBU0821254.1 restriction endonuclease subunit S [Gammaproteobacteria bacterium]MBU0840704.1 restriction endonuclease subunit S [Gammaproteobacteria bacterium]MBU1842933.1 restriction endonuclease subunit S [Gammaproteobacteria bacterium]